MSDQTGIEWTDATWNPVVGCSIVSPGCTNCYAMKQARGMERRFGSEKYAGLTRVVNGNPVWTGEVRLVESALDWPLRRKKPLRIFVNSMSDLFHEALPDEAIDKVFAVMALAPQHTFQILTKRPERMRAYMTDGQSAARRVSQIANGALVQWPLQNVWLGTSVEDQARADERIPLLLETPAAVRFLSCEPLLGPIDFRRVPGFNRIGLDLSGWWVIVGGESGPGARPMHPDWARSLRDQCAAADVAFFFKQWGEWAPAAAFDHIALPKTARIEVAWMNNAGVCNQRDATCIVNRVGKARAGRLLDGREWSEYPR